jgi:hypothetical protein
VTELVHALRRHLAGRHRPVQLDELLPPDRERARALAVGQCTRLHDHLLAVGDRAGRRHT